MKFKPAYRNIWSITLPLILIGLSESIVEITDTIFLAHYGTTELASIGVADVIYTLTLFLTFGLVDGIQITIGRRAGQEKNKAIGEVFNQGALLLFIISLFMMLVIIFIVPGITQHLLSSAEIHHTVNNYLGITAYALAFQAMNLAYSAFFVGISKTRVLIYAAIILLVSNISLDYILIFGNFGAPELGMKGAAIASLSAEILTFLFLTGHIISRHYIRTYGIFSFTGWNQKLSNKLLDLSIPVSLDALVEISKWLLLIVMIEKLGEQTLGIANIIFSCYALFLIPVESFSETVCTMVSNLIGQQQARKIRILIKYSMKLSYLVISPFIILTLVFPDYVISIFTLDLSLINNSINGLVVIALTAVLAVPANIFYATIAGTGDTRFALFTQIVSSLVALTYAFYAIFVLTLDLEYILLTEVIGLVICWILSWGWYRSGNWKRLRI